MVYSRISDREMSVKEKSPILHLAMMLEIQSTLSNSNYLGHRKNARITKISNYRDSNYRGFLLDLQGDLKSFFKLETGMIVSGSVRLWLIQNKTSFLFTLLPRFSSHFM